MVAMATTRFLPYTPGQILLLPPDLRNWLEEGHLAYFIQDVVEALDLSEIYASYDGSRGGRPGFDPRLLVGLLVYGYCVGVTSSRKIEKATHESVPFRVLAADQHPDHATIAEFRRRHLEALARLFVQILRLCEKAGLVRLGHVALDGTKMRANASKHKAMSYGRMEEKARELEAQVADLMAAAEAADQAEDAQHGSFRGDELPEELRFRKQRLEKIREAMAALEAELRLRRKSAARRKRLRLKRKAKRVFPRVNRRRPHGPPRRRKRTSRMPIPGSCAMAPRSRSSSPTTPRPPSIAKRRSLWQRRSRSKPMTNSKSNLWSS
jgi:transposase